LLIAVISPFLDRKHGTERCVIEQLERVPTSADVEIHLYAQRVEDLRGVVPYIPGRHQRDNGGSPHARIFWHEVPSFPGPHLLQYVFWFFANRALRWWDAHFRGLKYDLVYSPGINATDANFIAVHIVFHEFYDRVLPHLRYRHAPLANWPLLLHRRLYYRLIMALEERIYRRERVALAGVSGLVAGHLEKYFQRKNVRVIRNGVNGENLSPPRRLARRSAVRDQLRLASRDFTLLLIGNDWKKKGLDTLLEALGVSLSLPFKLLIVGHDRREPYQAMMESLRISDRVLFLNPSPDVLQFYSAADAYIGPSLEDAYGLPILEAMACGLPVVASSRAGASEIIEDKVSGLILRDPEDAQELTELLETLHANPELCRQMGENARLTALQHTWERNAAQLWEWLSAGRTKT
jgi:glycosyltransferase involved in cell wall biosynthesis